MIAFIAILLKVLILVILFSATLFTLILVILYFIKEYKKSILKQKKEEPLIYIIHINQRKIYLKNVLAILSLSYLIWFLYFQSVNNGITTIDSLLRISMIPMLFSMKYFLEKHEPEKGSPSRAYKFLAICYLLFVLSVDADYIRVNKQNETIIQCFFFLCVFFTGCTSIILMRSFLIQKRKELCIILFSYLIIVIVIMFSLLYREFGIVYNEAKVYDHWDTLYFSIVTLTTLGYGDFQPTPEIRLWASAQALLGYIFLALLMYIITFKTKIDKSN